MYQGNIFVISAPSGAGKSSLVKAVCKMDSQIASSISHTTRKMRANETNGKDYYFIDTNEFNTILQANRFIEYAKVYDNYYGTDINTITNLIDEGKDIILEIDWQGAQQIKKIMPHATLVYIMPPSLATLKERLISRNTDTIDIIQKRLALAINDTSHADSFDFIVINDDFDHALKAIHSIISVGRMRSHRILQDFIFK